MHRPRSTCSGACCKPCSTDCTSVVLHRSVSYSYLPLAETFPLCFDEGEGKHKRLCLLSHSLPPSPSRWSFSGLLCNRDAKYKPRSSCTWSLFASEACASAQRALFQLHSPRRRRGKEVILQLHCKEFSAALTWWAKAGSWKLLTWISMSPCERTFFLLGAQRIMGNVVLADA